MGGYFESISSTPSCVAVCVIKEIEIVIKSSTMRSMAERCRTFTAEMTFNGMIKGVLYINKKKNKYKQNRIKNFRIQLIKFGVKHKTKAL